MLYAWGLERNPVSVKIYRANSNNEAVYNGFTFKFSLYQEITTKSKLELLLDDSANILCGTLTHSLPLQTGKTQKETCSCTNDPPKKILCEINSLSKYNDGDIYEI